MRAPRHSIAMSLIRLAALGLGLAAWTAPTRAEGYPDHPIRIILPWADGFPANAPRLYAQEISKRLGQPIVLEIRPGAGGEIAARQVRAAAPDGYTLLATGTSITTSWASHPGNVDPEQDLRAIGQLVTTPYVIVARQGHFGSLARLLDAARRTPGKLNYASPGIGSGMHFLGELIKSNAHVDMVHVPYATGSQQLQAVLAGDVDIAIISLVTALPQIKAGKLEALAVSTTTRSKVAPEIPTLAESGVPGIPNIASWIALFGPSAMPAPLRDRLAAEIAAVAAQGNVGATVADWGAELPDTSAAFLARSVSVEKKVWFQLAKEKNLVVAP